MEVDQVVGGFRLRSLIATGQTSQVWEVVEVSSNRHFALKTLLQSAIRDREQVRLLYHEAKVGKALSHDNIIKIVKVGENAKQPYFVMDFFPAGSMKVRIVNKQVDFIRDNAQSIFKQMAISLAYMNQTGFVHRDVKPDNILVDSAGRAKLIDFAISQKIRKRGLFEKLFSKPKPQGTATYMSPEQIRCEDLDARADVYSFGASAYEIVTLRPPFRGANLQDLLNKHLFEKPVAPQAHNPEITDDFNKLVVAMLSKRREERPQNFHDVMIKMKGMHVFKTQAVGRSRGTEQAEG